MAGKRKLTPVKSGLELRWILQNNPALVKKLRALKIEITSRGGIRVPAFVGCPYGPDPSKCKKQPGKFEDLIYKFRKE